MTHAPGPLELALCRMADDAPLFGYTLKCEGKVPPIAAAGVSPPNHALIIDKEYEHIVSTGFSESEVEQSARLLAASYSSYDKHCGPRAVECAEGDLLGEAIEALRGVSLMLNTAISEYQSEPWAIKARAVLAEVE